MSSSTKRNKFDVIVIGGGVGGLVAAQTARAMGKSVAIVEKKQLGGECTWTGCVPTKTMMRVAQVAHDAKEFACYGLQSKSPIQWQPNGVLDHIRSVVQSVAATHSAQELEREGIQTFFDSPRFIDRTTIALEKHALTAKRFILATGSRPAIPGIHGLEDVAYLTNQTFFQLEKLPASIIILGGGSIGCEMAPMLSKLGVKVTLVETGPRLLNTDDPELVEILTQRFKDLGITVLTGTKVTRVEQNGDQVKVAVDAAGKTQILHAVKLLVATGRRPNVEGLALDNAGVKVGPKGVIVDKYLRTEPGTIYACGDLVGPYFLGHTARYQGALAARNAFAWWKTKANYDDLLWVTFSDEELASFGPHKGPKIITVHYRDIDRGKMDCTPYGMAKIVCKANGTILGAHILGPRAGEIIHELQLARCKGIKLPDLAKIMHAYPTYNILLLEAARKFSHA